MKRLLIALVLLLPVLSCTKKLVVPPDPENVDDGRTEILASVADYSGQSFLWSSSTKVGIYDSDGHSNQRYTLKNEFIGKTGEVSLYGSTIGGTAVAYLPYSDKGYPCVAQHRQPVLAEQKAGASAMEHLTLNTVLVAIGDDEGRFLFSYTGGNTGLIHLTLRCPVDGMVDKVVIHSPGAPLAGNVSMLADADPFVSGGSQYLTLTGVGRPSTEESPLQVWAQVPSGQFSRLTITLVSGDKMATAVVGGSITVPSGGCVDAVAEAVSSSSGNEDFTIIDGSYQ